MTWALRYDGTNDYSTVVVSSAENFTFRAKFSDFESGTKAFLAGTDGAFFPAVELKSNASCKIAFDNNQAFLFPLIDFSTLEELEIIKSGASMTINVNGSLHASGTTTSTNTFSFNRIAYTEILSPGNAVQMDLISFEFIDNDDGTNSRNWDATSSNHAAGTPRLDDISGNTSHALCFNMPTDGSVWINLGGGPITHAKTLSYTVIGTSTLDIMSTFNLSLLYSATTSVSLSKMVRKTFSYLAANTITIAKKVLKTTNYNTTGTVVQQEGIVLEQNINANASASSSLTTKFIEKGTIVFSNIARFAKRQITRVVTRSILRKDQEE